MKLSRRAPEPAVVAEELEPDEPTSGKGRPTPKRREKAVTRGPVTAPRTRKEAYARQRAQSKTARAARAAGRAVPTADMTPAQRRAALRSGEVLSKRDQGDTRRLARDYVDSHRLASNYFLLLFPLMVLSGLINGLAIVQAVTLLLAFGFIGEWYVIGRRVRRMAMERYGEAQGGNMSIGFYAGSRAYLPRRWRLPMPQVERGDQI